MFLRVLFVPLGLFFLIMPTFNNNLPTGIGHMDDNGHFWQGTTRDEYEAAQAASGNGINANNGKELFPGVNGDSSLDWFYKFIQDVHNQGGFTDDQIDAIGNTILQLLMREEDFQRSSPEAQVQRLMAAGMSRSAALAALQQQQYGDAKTGIAGNVEQSKTDRMNAIGNMIQSAVSIAQQVGSIIELGQSIKLNTATIQLQAQQAQYYNQVAQQIAQGNMISKAQYEAYSYAALGTQAIANYCDKYQIDLPDNFYDALQLASKNEHVDPAIENWYKIVHKQGLSNPYYYNIMQTAYDNMKKGTFEMAAYKRQTQAQARVTEATIPKIVSDIAKNESDIETSNENLDLIKAQVRNTNAATTQTNALTNRINLETKAEHTVDNVTGYTPYEANVRGIARVNYYAACLEELDYKLENDYLFPAKCEQALLELDKWQSLSPADRQKAVNAFVQSFENRDLVMQVTARKLANMNDFHTDHTSLSYLFDLFDSYDVISQTFNTALDAGAAFGTGAALKGLVRPLAPLKIAGN